MLAYRNVSESAFVWLIQKVKKQPKATSKTLHASARETLRPIMTLANPYLDALQDFRIDEKKTELC